MNEQKLNKISKIKGELLRYNYEFPDAVDDNYLQEFKTEYNKYFGIDIDNNYIDFIKIVDGLDFNGVRIYASKDRIKQNDIMGIFETNKLWKMDDENEKKYVYFGDSDLEVFVLDIPKHIYQSISRYTGDIIKKFNNFDEMLLHILNLMLKS